MNNAPDKQTPENRYIAPCNPIQSMSSGKNLRIMNEHNDKTAIQNDTPNSFKFCGITSPITVYGRVEMPNVARKMIIAKLIIGIQLNASTLKFHCLNTLYEANVIKPNAAPTVDTTYKNWRKKIDKRKRIKKSHVKSS